MAKTSRHDALAVDRPEEFLRRERIVQRAGIGFLALFVLAGAAGAFGTGPLSQVAIRSGGITLTGERFTRQTYRTTLEIEAQAPDDRTVEMRVSRAFLSVVDLLEVRPVSALNRLEPDVAVFEVPAARGKAILELQYEPQRNGVLDIEVSVGGDAAAVRQIVFF